MKNNLIQRTSFLILVFLLGGIVTESNVQAQTKKSNPDVFFPNRKKTSPVRKNPDQVVVKNEKSNPDVFFPNRKRTSPVVHKRTYPVHRNQQHLPPGQAKKIYGGKSAKPYAPGQRKKVYNSSYNKNKHWSKKHKHYKHKDHK